MCHDVPPRPRLSGKPLVEVLPVRIHRDRHGLLMTASAKIGKWASKSRLRPYLLILTLMLPPITIFAYSVGRVLRHQAQTQAVTESTQISRVAAALLEEQFRQSTSFLESIATRRTFCHAWAT